MVPEFPDQAFLLISEFRGMFRFFEGAKGFPALSVASEGLTKVEQAGTGGLVLCPGRQHKMPESVDFLRMVSCFIGSTGQQKEGLSIGGSLDKVAGLGECRLWMSGFCLCTDEDHGGRPIVPVDAEGLSGEIECLVPMSIGSFHGGERGKAQGFMVLGTCGQIEQGGGLLEMSDGDQIFRRADQPE